MALHNRINEFEKEICSALSQMAYHLHSKIIARIQNINSDEYKYFEDLFEGKIDVRHYLYEGSACVFPGVRRYVSGEGDRKKYSAGYRAILDDNLFPRHVWCFLENGKAYSGSNWKKTGLNGFELAHIFSHKESELEFEQQFFSKNKTDLFPYGDFTSACNVVLLPKGTVRPTDNSKAIKAAFYKRYIDLYGEGSLNGRSGFKVEEVPVWYDSLIWNEPHLPDGWEVNIKELMLYRTKRISHLLQSIPVK